jgi:hypothetical protein
MVEWSVIHIDQNNPSLHSWREMGADRVPRCRRVIAETDADANVAHDLVTNILADQCDAEVL